MTLAKEVPVASTDTMIAAVEEVGTEAVEITAVAVIMMIVIEDTEEAVIATTMDLVSTDMAVVDARSEDTIDVEVVAATLTVTNAEVTGAETVKEDAAMAHHRQPNMVIQLLAESLENLMVGSALLVKLHDLDSVNSFGSAAFIDAGALPLGAFSHLFSSWSRALGRRSMAKSECHKISADRDFFRGC